MSLDMEMNDAFVMGEWAGLDAEHDREEIDRRFAIRKNMRLSADIVSEIVPLVNRHKSMPSLNDYELVYDVLHYFMFAAKFIDETIPATYIQQCWPSCHKKYLDRMNWLKSIGIFVEGGLFKPIAPGRSLYGGAQRTYTLAPNWFERVIKCRKDVSPIERPYGFQAQLKEVYDKLPSEQREALYKSVPRRLQNKLAGREPVESSTQPWFCGMIHILSDYRRAINSLRSDRPPISYVPNPRARTHWLGRLVFHGEGADVPPQFRNRCMNRTIMAEYDQLIGLSSFAMEGEIDPDDPNAPDTEWFPYAGRDMDGNSIYAHIKLRTTVKPIRDGEVSHGQLRAIRRLEAIRNGP